MIQTILDAWSQIRPVFWQLFVTSILIYLVWLLVVISIENFREAIVRSRLDILARYQARTQAAQRSGCVYQRYEVAAAICSFYERPKMSRRAQWCLAVFVALFVCLSLLSMVLAVGQSLRQLAA